VTDGEKMEGSCSTGQSPQRAVVPMEEEEEEEEEVLSLAGDHNVSKENIASIVRV
jgi:hypothetical protein